MGAFADLINGSAEAQNTVNQSLTTLSSQVNETIVQNSNFVANNIGANQSVKFYNGPNGKINNCDIKILQTTDASINTMMTGEIQNTTQVQNKLENDISQAAQQIAEAASGLLGGNATAENTMNMTTVIKNVMSNNLTVNNIAQAVSSSLINQDANFINEGTIECSDADKSIEINQYIAVKLATQSIMKTVNSNIFQNDELNRIVQSAKQSAKATSDATKGIIGIILATTLLMLVLKNMKVHPTVLLAILLIIIGLVFYARTKKVGPFKGSAFWGCVVDDKGLNTGLCEEKDSRAKGPFSSKEDCETKMANGGSQNCPTFYGCTVASNGNYDSNAPCKQYADLGGADGNGLGFRDGYRPFYTKKACEEAKDKACKTVWGCDIEGRKDGTAQGVYIQGPCVEYNNDAKIKPLFTYDTADQCGGTDNQSCRGLYYRPDTSACPCSRTYIDLNKLSADTKNASKIKFYDSLAKCLQVMPNCPQDNKGERVTDRDFKQDKNNLVV